MCTEGVLYSQCVRVMRAMCVILTWCFLGQYQVVKIDIHCCTHMVVSLRGESIDVCRQAIPEDGLSFFASAGELDCALSVRSCIGIGVHSVNLDKTCVNTRHMGRRAGGYRCRCCTCRVMESSRSPGD